MYWDLKTQLEAMVLATARMTGIGIELSFIRASDGGRRVSARSGYRTQVRFADCFYDACFAFEKTPSVTNCEWVKGYAQFLDPPHPLGFLRAGNEFEVCEGWKVVARGKVL